LRSQCFARARVASESQAGFSARAKISTEAKYFGAFVAGLPSGFKSLAEINGAMSCSLNPSNSAASVTFSRAGSLRQFSKEMASLADNECLAANIFVTPPDQLDGEPTMGVIIQEDPPIGVSSTSLAARNILGRTRTNKPRLPCEKLAGNFFPASLQ